MVEFFGVKNMITLSQWAKRIGVTRQVARAWAMEGRFQTMRPVPLVVLINENTPRPEARMEQSRQKSLHVVRKKT